MLYVHIFAVWVALIGAIATALFSRQELSILADGLKAQNAQLALQVKATQQQGEDLKVQSHLLAAGSARDLDLQLLEVQKLLFSEPKLRAYFYDGKHPRTASSADELARAKMIAEMLIDFMEQFANPHVDALPNMKRGEKFWGAWDNYFEYLFENSPLLCKTYKDSPETWTYSRISEHVQAQCN